MNTISLSPLDLPFSSRLGEVRLRGGDKQVRKYMFSMRLQLTEAKAYKKMQEHPDIRYKLKRIEKASDKVYTLIQVCVLFAYL